MNEQNLDILILTGQSGSGKSTAMRAAEDAGYFCVDNLPVALLEDLVSLCSHHTDTNRTRLALVMDLRERQFLQTAPKLVPALKAKGHRVRVVFLAAQQDVVLRRYSQTRRLHPLDGGGGLREAVVAEQALLEPLREMADEVIDTSRLTPHGLRASIIERVGGAASAGAMRVTVLSFGFKNGVPSEADMVLDVRFLPNPFFVPELSAHSGMQPAVADYVLQKPDAKAFLSHADNFLRFLLPHYQAEGKRYFTLGIGCTGGRHRSVAIAAQLTEQLCEAGFAAELRHRDMAAFVADSVAKLAQDTASPP